MNHKVFTGPKKLNKFCSIPVMLDIITHRRIELLDPINWSDKNDVHNMVIYKERFEYKFLLATCFLASSETIHHWGQYADGMLGCCIEFSPRIINSIVGKSEYRCGMVDYSTLKKIKEKKAHNLPFLKRKAYYVEDEFRVIYQGNKPSARIRFKTNDIIKITLNQRLPSGIIDTITGIINGICDCHVVSSTIEDSSTWKNSVNMMVSLEYMEERTSP